MPTDSSICRGLKSPAIALVVRSNREGVSRLPRALRSAGLRVVLFARPDSFAARTIHRDVFYPSAPPANKLMNCLLLLRFLWRLEREAPAMAIPGGEPALIYLSRVASCVRRAGLGWFFPKAVAALRAGLPARATVPELLCRGDVAVIAERCGIAMPHWCRTDEPERVRSLCETARFPMVVKRDETNAGMGVTVCNNTEELAATIEADPTPGIVQGFVEGRPAMQAAVAVNGRLLATRGWLKEQCFPEPFGPSSIIARIDEPSMADAARRFASETHFNGFFSLDFIVGEGTPRLIEINPRPTPVCHLGPLAVELARALGVEPARESPQVPGRLAIFPQELRRNPASADDPDMIHDLPEDDPGLLQAFADTYFEGKIPVVQRTLGSGEADLAGAR